MKYVVLGFIFALAISADIALAFMGSELPLVIASKEQKI